MIVRRVALCLLLFVMHQPLIAAKPLTFVRIIGSFNQVIAQKVLYEVYQRAGIEVVFVSMTAKRSSSEASNGHKDGELIRVASAAQSYPSLVRVPTPIYQLQSQVFARRDSLIEIKGFKDLILLKTVIVRGVLHAESLVKQAAVKNVHRLESATKMFKFVSLSRADIALSSLFNGTVLIKRQHLDNVVPLGEPLAQEPLYHYLHAKHVHLVQRIDAIIRQMKNSGELARMIHEYEQEVLDGLD